MKNSIKFLIFILYATVVFFLPNNANILFLFIFHVILMLFLKTNYKKIVKNLINFLPFILFTVIFNWLLDNYMNAIWIGVKLLLVCNITFIYAQTTTIGRNSKNNKIFMHSFKTF